MERALGYGPLAAIEDRPRPGKEPVITPEAKAWLVSLACDKAKEHGYPHELWTTRLLARHAREHGPTAGHECLARLVQGTVCKILGQEEIKPHKVRYYLELTRLPDGSDRCGAIPEPISQGHCAISTWRGTDVVARPAAGFLSRAFGQQFYIENKSGAGGNIGIEAATRSEPDGYTLLMAPVAIVARPHVSDLKIDPIKDLISVIQLSRQPLVIAVHPSLGVRTLTELVAAARREPGLRYGLGGGIGNEQHILGAWFAQLADITLEPVPYRGGGPAINDLLAGHVKVASLGAAPIVQHYLAGSVRAPLARRRAITEPP